MHVRLPVQCNIGLACTTSVDKETHGYVSVPTDPTSTPPLPPKGWKHPGFVRDARHMVAAVAKARGLIGRTTAATVGQSTEPVGISVPAHVARLAAKWELVAYMVSHEHVEAEVCARGPVVAAMRVTTSILDYVSARLADKDAAAYTTPSQNVAECGMVMVAMRTRH